MAIFIPGISCEHSSYAENFWENDPVSRGRVQRILDGLDELSKELKDAIEFFLTA